MSLITYPRSQQDAKSNAQKIQIGLSLVEFMAKALVDHPDQVVVTNDGSTHLYVKITCHPDDVGKLIGKGGQNADAMRRILRSVGHRLKMASGIEIVE